MQAHDMPFTQLINVDQGAHEHFHVPKYQREYTWRKWQWEQLLEDIKDSDPGYFMGSIICVNNTTNHTAGDEIIFEVVDGQQRLTTLSLLLVAVYTKLHAALQTYTPEDEDDKTESASWLPNIKAKLIKKKPDARSDEPGAVKIGNASYFLRVQPSSQNQNLADYLYLLALVGLTPTQPKIAKPAYFGNRLFGKAYQYFLEQIPTDMTELRGLVKKINQLIFVQISVGSHADAFTLFESLNNRGVPLSAMDIIKNQLLAAMQQRHQVAIDESYERWQALVAVIPEAHDQERFLRQFYNTFKHLEKIKVRNVARATRSQVIRIYEDLIKRDAPFLFDKLSTSATVYGQLIRAESDDKAVANGLLELERIGAASAYQVLLYLFTLDGSHFADAQFLPQVVNLLQRYFLRRNITDTPPTRQIDQALIDVVEECAKLIQTGNKLEFPWFAGQLMKLAKPATLAEFKQALAGPLYDVSVAMTRYVLIQLDQLHQTREYRPDFWNRDDQGRFIWTVEHVLPQADKLPTTWVDMIAGGDRAKASDIQDHWVHCLGNLTLSGYNADLATASFENKQKLAKDRSFLGHKIDVGYKNGLALNRLVFGVGNDRLTLAEAPKWSAEMIDARTKAMVELIAKANLLPGE